MIANRESTELLEKLKSNDILNEMISPIDMKFLEKQTAPIEIPEMLCRSEWSTFDFSNKSTHLQYFYNLFLI